MEPLRVCVAPTAARGPAIAARAVLMLGGPFFRLPDLDGGARVPALLCRPCGRFGRSSGMLVELRTRLSLLSLLIRTMLANRSSRSSPWSKMLLGRRSPSRDLLMDSFFRKLPSMTASYSDKLGSLSRRRLVPQVAARDAIETASDAC